MNYRKFVHSDSKGNPWGIVSAEQLWAHVYALKYSKPKNPLEQSSWRILFENANAAAIEFGAHTIVSRIRLDYDPDLFRNLLNELGFKKKSGRIEYQSDVERLPNEDGTPFQWRTAKELNWDQRRLAHFTKKVTEGALDVDPNEKPEDFIQDWLHHDELTSGPGCIGIGFYNDQPCALAVVQINNETGWSRISYMGLIPDFRGIDLGKWVHRHGFTMMKEQDGKLYHGGTLTQNHAMKKLFESHGCHVFCEMEEWSCNLKGGTE